MHYKNKKEEKGGRRVVPEDQEWVSVSRRIDKDLKLQPEQPFAENQRINTIQNVTKIKTDRERSKYVRNH